MSLLSILGIVEKVIDNVVPDPNKKMELKLELAKLADAEAERESKQLLGQLDINKTEAGSTSVFVAGWRPFIGWAGGVGLAYSFVLEPIMSWSARVIFKYSGDFPALDTSSLMVLVTGMLGFGGLRAMEKIKGVPDSTPLGVNNPVVAPKKKILGVEWPF